MPDFSDSNSLAAKKPTKLGGLVCVSMPPSSRNKNFNSIALGHTMIEYIDPTKQALLNFARTTVTVRSTCSISCGYAGKHATQMDDQQLAPRPMPPTVVKAGRCLPASAAELSGKASSN